MKPQPVVSLRLSLITKDGSCHTHRPETGMGMGIPNTPLTPLQVLNELYNALVKLSYLAGPGYQRDITNLIQMHQLNHYVHDKNPNITQTA